MKRAIEKLPMQADGIWRVPCGNLKFKYNTHEKSIYW